MSSKSKSNGMIHIRGNENVQRKDISFKSVIDTNDVILREAQEKINESER